MKFLSVCSGIEAASVAWNPIGWEAVGFSEIEPFPCSVLKQHYPEVQNFGDMTRFMEWPDANVDVLCGGTPCQSFSVAGLRKGLDDPRGNLMLTFLAIAKRYRPSWVVWENVPGVLSSNGGRDFGSFLGGLAECGYGFAYRVLDAQYFGLAQRRKRVFVVGYLGDWHRAAAVLFEQHSLQGHPAPRREKGKRVAGTITAGTGMCGASDNGDPNKNGALICADIAPTVTNGPPFSRTGNDRVEADAMVWPADVASTLNAHFGDKQGLEDQHALGGGHCSSLPEVAMCLNAGGMKRQDSESETLIPTIGGGFDEPVTYDLFNVTAPVNRQNRHPGDPCHTLARSNAEHAAVVQPVGVFQDSEFGVQQYDSAGTLRAGRIPEHQMVLQPAIAWDEELNASVEQAGTLLRGGAGGRHDGVAVAFYENQRSEVTVNDTAGSLTVGGGKPGQGYPALLTAMQVRRLTPVECERLQGFPDGYTAIPWRNKPASECPDGPRYKALGNSWAVPVVRWIGERINKVEAWTF